MTGFDSKQRMAADKLHWSDCAVHNGPAYPVGEGECDCGVAQEPAEWLTGCPTCGMEAGCDCDTGTWNPPQPAQEPDALTIAYQNGFYDGKKAALAGREWNFCERCGKRTADLTVIHTCTPPQEKNNG